MKIFFQKIFITSKVPSWNFWGSFWGLFCSIMHISGVIGKTEPFVTRVTRKSATVKGPGMTGPAKLDATLWRWVMANFYIFFSISISYCGLHCFSRSVAWFWLWNWGCINRIGSASHSALTETVDLTHGHVSSEKTCPIYLS